MLAKYSLDDSPYQDFVFFSPDASDYARRVYEAAEGVRFPNEAKNVRQFVRFITNFCATNTVVARKIRIVSHGNPTWFWIGKSRITVSSIEGKYRKDLRNLALFLVPGVTLLEIFACRTGQNKNLLIALSTVLDGVPVRAYREAQSGKNTKGVGPSETCWGNRCTQSA